LGRLGGERHVPPLLEALEDRIPGVCVAAAISLGYLRDPRALAALNDVRVTIGSRWPERPRGPWPGSIRLPPRRVRAGPDRFTCARRPDLAGLR
jgi:hypothetical protein